MNRDEKAAVIDEVAERIEGSQAIFAIDYRGLSVKQAVELRQRLNEADAHFQVVKNRLTIRSADKAGAEGLKGYLEGPTALAFVQGDVAVAAKALATFRRENGLLEFKGGTLDGDVLTVDQIESIARLPAREVLHGQFVGVLASPITGLVRGLASMIGGLASQLQQIADQGLVTGEAPAAAEAPAEDAAPAEADAPAADAPAEDAAPAEGEAPPEEAPAEDAAPAADAPAEEPDAGADAPAETATEEAPAEEAEPAPAADASDEDATPAEEAPGSPTAEAETAEQEEASESTDTPSEGEKEQEG